MSTHQVIQQTSSEAFSDDNKMVSHGFLWSHTEDWFKYYGGACTLYRAVYFLWRLFCYLWLYGQKLVVVEVFITSLCDSSAFVRTLVLHRAWHVLLGLLQRLWFCRVHWKIQGKCKSCVHVFRKMFRVRIGRLFWGCIPSKLVICIELLRWHFWKEYSRGTIQKVFRDEFNIVATTIDR